MVVILLANFCVLLFSVPSYLLVSILFNFVAENAKVLHLFDAHYHHCWDRPAFRRLSVLTSSTDAPTKLNRISGYFGSILAEPF